MDVRVMIIADDPLARAGLAALLRDLPGVTVTGQAAPDDDLEAALDAHRPDVILWDLGWDVGDGVLRLADVAGEPSMRPVVVLLPDDAPASKAWAAGASGLLRRDESSERMAAALVAAAEGFVVLEPAFSPALIPRREPGGGEPSAGPLVESLTPRELEVLLLLAEGLPNKTVAQRLGISEHTVKFHVNAILGKLGVESRTEAVVRATRLGLILL